jgi:hypothetical protein
MRSTFQEIIIKPLYLQMILQYPELRKDRDFKTNLGLVFTRENQFQEFVKLANLTKRVAFINSMSELQVSSGEEQTPYFSKDFLVRRFLGLSPDEYSMNNKYKEAEKIMAEKKEKTETPEEPTA